MKVKDLYEQKKAALKLAQSTRDMAKAEGRELTDDEAEQIDSAMDSVEALDISIEEQQAAEEANAKRLDRLATIEKKVAQPVPARTANIRITDVRAAIENDGKRGFKSHGEFFKAIIQAGLRGGFVDNRLKRSYDQEPSIEAATLSTYGTEGSGPDGGYAVPPTFSDEIKSYMLGEESFLPMTDQVEVAGNSFSYPRDITTPWGTTGVLAYFIGEGAAATQSKPALEYSTLRLLKLMCLVPLTDELLEDTRAMETYIPRKCGEAIMYKINDKLVNGNGANEPLGIYNSGAIVSVAKEASQTATTINAANVSKMAGILAPGSLPRAVWLIGPDSWNQLPRMVIGDQPVWLPPNGLAAGTQAAPYGTLFGRPVIVTNTCQTLGTTGDIYLVDWSKYVTITKGGIEQTTSIHLWFDQDVTAFRARIRMNGQPAFDETIAADYGSATYSPYVKLDTRA